MKNRDRLLKIIYPFWLFLFKTKIGFAITFGLIPISPLFIFISIISNVDLKHNEYIDSLGVLISFGLIALSPFIVMYLWWICVRLENNYRRLKK